MAQQRVVAGGLWCMLCVLYALTWYASPVLSVLGATELCTPHCSECVELAGLQPDMRAPSQLPSAGAGGSTAARPVAAAATSTSSLMSCEKALSPQCCVWSSSRSALPSWSAAMSQLSLSQSGLLLLGWWSSLKSFSRRSRGMLRARNLLWWHNITAASSGQVIATCCDAVCCSSSVPAQQVCAYGCRGYSCAACMCCCCCA